MGKFDFLMFLELSSTIEALDFFRSRAFFFLAIRAEEAKDREIQIE